MRLTKALLVAASTLALVALAGPSVATAGVDETDDLQLMIKVGEQEPRRLVLDDVLPAPSAYINEQGIQPYLIDTPAAWIACFGPVFDPNYSLQSFSVNGWGVLDDFTARLACGDANTKTSGWHHIQDRHQSQWQARLDDANSAGPGDAATWDDLMALATSSVLEDPWWYTQEYSGKRCFTQEILVYENETGDEIFRAWPSVVVSMTSKQIITSYPSRNIDCTRFASWA